MGNFFELFTLRFVDEETLRCFVSGVDEQVRCSTCMDEEEAVCKGVWVCFFFLCIIWYVGQSRPTLG